MAIFFLRSAALGGVEELAKLLALIWFSWSTAKPWVPKSPPAKTWPRSQRGVMLAGFSTGVGLMVVENFRVFMLVNSMLFHSRHAVLVDNLPVFDEFALQRFSRLLVFRILLNPHPWLTGILAGRFARCTASGGSLTWRTLWTVLWPSAALHALLNLNSPFPWHRFADLIICWIVFKRTWDSLEHDEQPNQSTHSKP